ncbi:MAG TPA: hypothetical protein VH419_03480 [Nocardioidaceae bacterium]
MISTSSISGFLDTPDQRRPAAAVEPAGTQTPEGVGPDKLDQQVARAHTLTTT